MSRLLWILFCVGAFVVGLEVAPLLRTVQAPSSEIPKEIRASVNTAPPIVTPDHPSAPPQLGNPDSVSNYLRARASLFPALPADGISLYLPELVDERIVLNRAQLHMSVKEMESVQPRTFVNFLTKFIDMMHRFNCDNFPELFQGGIVVMNVLESREPTRARSLLPIVTVSGKSLSVEEGFATLPETCIELSNAKDRGRSYKVQPVANPEQRLLDLLQKHAPQGNGTGWPLSNGLIVTNHHVVADGSRFFVVKQDRTFVEARVLYEDQFEDLVLLKVQDTTVLPPALRLSTKPATLGQEVFTIGYPWTSTIGNVLPQPQLTKGVISSFPREWKAHPAFSSHS